MSIQPTEIVATCECGQDYIFDFYEWEDPEDMARQALEEHQMGLCSNFFMCDACEDIKPVEGAKHSLCADCLDDEPTALEDYQETEMRALTN
jgi:hypothetical protein